MIHGAWLTLGFPISATSLMFIANAKCNMELWSKTILYGMDVVSFVSSEWELDCVDLA
jgi:hypothetical protein